MPLANRRASNLWPLLACLMCTPARAEDVPVSQVNWHEDVAHFGGLSGLALKPDGKAFWAVSDDGYLAQGVLDRDAAGQLSGVHLLHYTQLMYDKTRPATGFQRDSEGLRLAPDGSLFISFEGYARIQQFLPPKYLPKSLHAWDRFKAIWNNQGMEALALRRDGSLLAVLEMPGADGAYKTFFHKPKGAFADGPPLATDGRFDATDADFGPDGRLYLLERSFSYLWGYQTRISVYAPDAAGFGPPQVAMLTKLGTYGDFEGMDVWKNAKGEMIATLISDNNFLPLTDTTIAEFRLSP